MARASSVDATRVRLVERLVAGLGGRFSTEMGIDVDQGDQEVGRWVLAATLFGTRISAKVAVRTYRCLSEAGMGTPAGVGGRTWEELVAVLDEGGYVRYDFRTATRLQALAAVLEREGVRSFDRGSLAETRAALDDLPGWGPVTVSLFLRELRGVLPQVDPPLDGRAAEAGEHLRLLAGQGDLLERLRAVATEADVDVRDAEASLVRLWLAHHRDLGDCPGGVRCRALPDQDG